MDEPRRDAPLADAPQPGAIPDDMPVAPPGSGGGREAHEPGEPGAPAPDLDDPEHPSGGGVDAA